MTISASVKGGKWHRTSLTTDAEIRDAFLSRREIPSACGIKFHPFNSTNPGESPRAIPSALCSKCFTPGERDGSL